MAQFIKLTVTSASGGAPEAHLINVEDISHIKPAPANKTGALTLISRISDPAWAVWVVETVEQIDELILAEELGYDD